MKSQKVNYQSGNWNLIRKISRYSLKRGEVTSTQTWHISKQKSFSTLIIKWKRYVELFSIKKTDFNGIRESSKLKNNLYNTVIPQLYIKWTKVQWTFQTETSLISILNSLRMESFMSITLTYQLILNWLFTLFKQRLKEQLPILACKQWKEDLLTEKLFTQCTCKLTLRWMLPPN